MRVNKLRINPDKTEILLVGLVPAPRIEYILMLDGVACPLKDQVRSLGVLLDEQIAAVSRSTFHQPRPVYYLHTFLDKKDLTTVSPALVTSRLNYCNVLYVGLPLDMAQKLQLVQNAAECIWTGANRFQHITPVLRKLHWQ